LVVQPFAPLKGKEEERGRGRIACSAISRWMDLGAKTLVIIIVIIDKLCSPMVARQMKVVRKLTSTNLHKYTMSYGCNRLTMYALSISNEEDYSDA